MEVSELVVRIAADVSALKAGLAEGEASVTAFSARMKSVGTTMENAGKSMRNVGKDLSKWVTLPVLAVSAAGVKMGVDFQDSMQKIVGLVGVSQKQVNSWSTQILGMGKTLPQGPKELADALFFVTSAGLRGKAAMDVLTNSAKAAAAGLGDTKTIADAVTSAVNSYGEKNLSASRATDDLVTAVKEGKVAAADLAPAIGKVLPLASAMGVSFEDVSAAIASMTRQGTDAATSVTQVRAVLSSVLKPSKGASDEMKHLGLSAASIRAELKDKGLLGTLTDLSKRLGGNRDELGKLFPNVRALAGFLALTGSNAKANAEIFRGLTHDVGATNTAFKDASQTLGFKLKQSWAQMQDALVKWGDTLAPTTEKLASLIATASSGFAGLNSGTQQLVVSAALLAAAVGPLVYVLGSFATLIGGTAKVIGATVSGFTAAASAIGEMAFAATAAIPGLEGLSLAIASNPLVAGAAILVGAVAGVVLALHQMSHSEDAVTEASRNADQAVRDLSNSVTTLAQNSLFVKTSALQEKVSTLAAAEAHRTYLQAVKEHGKGSLQAREALLQWRSANLQAKQAVIDHTNAVKTNESALQTIAKQGPKLSSDLETLTEARDKDKAALKLWEGQAKVGGQQAVVAGDQIAKLKSSIQKNSEKIDTDRGKIQGWIKQIQTAGSTGVISASQVHRLTAELQGIPPSTTAKVSIDVLGIGALQNATNHLEEIMTHPNVTSTVHTRTVKGHAKGGPITGPGTGTSDSVPFMGSNGEFVVRADGSNLGDAIAFFGGSGYAAGGPLYKKAKAKPFPHSSELWRNEGVLIAKQIADMHRHSATIVDPAARNRYEAGFYGREAASLTAWLKKNEKALSPATIATVRKRVDQYKGRAVPNAMSAAQQLAESFALQEATLALHVAMAENGQYDSAAASREGIALYTQEAAAFAAGAKKYPKQSAEFLQDQASALQQVYAYQEALKSPASSDASSADTGSSDVVATDTSPSADMQAQIDQANTIAANNAALYAQSQHDIAALTSSGDIGFGNGANALRSAGDTYIMQSLVPQDPRMFKTVSDVSNVGNSMGNTANLMYSGTSVGP